MKEFKQLKKNLKKDFSNHQKVKVAILGDSATQFLNMALRGAGFDESLDLDIFEADFNQIDQQVYNPVSDLYSHDPDFIILLKSSHKLLGSYNKASESSREVFSKTNIDDIENLLDAIEGNSKAKVILFNFNEIDDAIYGNYSNSVQSSFLYQLRKLNVELMDLSIRRSGLFICDLSSIQNVIGKSIFFAPSIYVNTEMVFSIDVLPIVAFKTISIIKSVLGRIKKCLILDLDNTTWGGVIGDDGLENIQIGSLGIGKSFTELQQWAKKLVNRGVILAICSKNTESIAKEPFEKHPDMVLRMEDISVFMANWENKADNIRQIQSILNIGFDSMVFLDDNAFERNIVRENLPDVCVPELPEDPAEYLEYLYSLNLFETVSVSKEDSTRTQLYQTEAKRVKAQKQFTNVDEFLENLNMKSVVEEPNRFSIPRVAQLSQRSNQFNLRTIRYTEQDIHNFNDSEKHKALTFDLKDQYGEHGLICVIILEKLSDKEWFIDTWFMSCRILKRGMESFVVNTLAEMLKEEGAEKLIGEYIPTKKNVLVKDHYKDLGFEDSGDGKWTLELADFSPLKMFIEKA